MSCPVVPREEGHRSTDKRYAGDNRLIIPESPYRRNRLAAFLLARRVARLWDVSSSHPQLFAD